MREEVEELEARPDNVHLQEFFDKYEEARDVIEPHLFAHVELPYDAKCALIGTSEEGLCTLLLLSLCLAISCPVRCPVVVNLGSCWAL